MLRRGTTLAELLVALVLGAIILGAATASLLRQQRSAATLVTGARVATQLRMATGLFAAQLALHAAGDLALADARDSTLQLRTSVANGIACETSTTPSFAVGGDDLGSGGLTAPPRAGDSLWWYRPDDDAWTGRAVLAAATASGACGAASAGLTVHLQLSSDDTIPLHAPLRMTRPERLVVYRAGDGTAQLGLREWSAGAGALGSPQPVAGPFVRSAGSARTGFRYFDATGAELFPSAAVPGGTAVARVRLTALAATPRAGVVAIDSMDVALGRMPAP